MLRNALALLTFTAVLAVPGTAFAKGGPGGATPPPTANTTPCITVTAKSSGVTVHRNLPSPTFEVTNCGAGALTIVPSYVDQATDAWPLNRDCGPAAKWTAAPVTIAAAKSTTISTFTVRGHCPAAEFHHIAATFSTTTGTVVGTSDFYWVDSIKP